MLIVERIGHEYIKYAMETYGHLYPDKYKELTAKLEELHFSIIAQYHKHKKEA